MKYLFNKIYKDKKILITGHTGFKGSWLSLWLQKMGAEIIGYSLSPATKPSHFELLGIDFLSIIDDIRDCARLNKVIQQEKPEIVFHLAAQALVRRSYDEPIETFSTNLMGTVNLLEACRHCPSVKAIVVVTSDKCYENKELSWGTEKAIHWGGVTPIVLPRGASK